MTRESVYVCVREWEEGGSVCVHVCVCCACVVCVYVCVCVVCLYMSVCNVWCVCVFVYALSCYQLHLFLAMAHSLGELWTARTLFSRGQRKTFGQGYVMSHVIGSIMSVAQYRNVAYPEINHR